MVITDDYDVEIFHNMTGDYPDGTYCAEVEYYNPNTGTRNTYTLNVDVEDGDLTVIHWPNGGWLDETHFSPENISYGEISFISDRGCEYVVTLGDYGGGCYSDGKQLQNDVNIDIEDTTCPNCGGNKDVYEDLCYSCTEERESVCPRCGSYKISFDEYCNNCQDELTNEE
ncbi:hypothetical protein [Flavobacterium suaedae]|nr:hypothetical protein [Flavobacterium suaedae]